MWHVERQADPYHLALRQLNKAKSSHFSLGMFLVSSRSRDARKRAVTAFSKDAKARSSSIRAEPRRHYKIYPQVT